MEGIPADLVDYKDSNVEQDHSYYGNGCEAHMYSPCSTRFADTADGETQKNGTLLNFQAATSGSGGAITTPNANAPDTFCPLGWQLPYSGTGGDYYDKSRSWDYLFTAYSISFNTGTTADATKIKSYPFSYVYPGYYDWATGRLYSLGTSTGLWASTVNNSTGAYFMATWSTAVHSNLTTNRARGYTLHCVLFFSNLSSTARWKERIVKQEMQIRIYRITTPIMEMVVMLTPGDKVEMAALMSLVLAELLKHLTMSHR